MASHNVDRDLTSTSISMNASASKSRSHDPGPALDKDKDKGAEGQNTVTIPNFTSGAYPNPEPYEQEEGTERDPEKPGPMFNTEVGAGTTQGQDDDGVMPVVEEAPDSERELASEASFFRRLSAVLLKWGVETQGIDPIPEESRTDPRISQFFWLWFGVSFNILAFTTGSAGPAFFGLGLESVLGVILVVDPMTCAIPAYFAVFGPKLGMRAMVQSRYSWGLYGAMIPSVLNVISMEGFLVLNCIIGGQILASASDKLDDTLGIVIISLISLVVTFCGCQVLHWFESIAWIPSLVVFPILIGIGLAEKHLDPSTTLPPPSAAVILSFASFVASSVVSWCTLTPDYGVYHDHKAPTLKIFLYTYLGFLMPTIAWHMLGAAFAAAAPGIPAWASGFHQGTDVGGLLRAVLAPAGGFGRFVLVLLALGTSCAAVPTMYTFGTSFMAIAPSFARVPRYVFIVVSEIILIPLAIIGAKTFYSTLVDVLTVIGYWSTSFAAIVLTEHFLFRRRRGRSSESHSPPTSPSTHTSTSTYNYSYNPSHWDRPSLLPPGLAALTAFLCSWAIIVPTMQQTWYTGAIAARAGTGDVGVFAGGVVGAGVYVVVRRVERRVWVGR